MRNSEGVESPRIFKMEEVDFDFRPYYRVEVAGAGADDTTHEDEASTDTPAGEDSAPSWGDSAQPSEPEPEPLVYSLPDEQPADEVVTDHEPDEAEADELVGASPFDTLDVPTGESDMPPPPEGDAVEREEDGSDPMISVRRGLFGR